MDIGSIGREGSQGDAHGALVTMTQRGARRRPDHPALILGDEQLTYAALHDEALRCVAALRASGIGKGDRVGYLGLNSIDYVILLQAAVRIGAVMVAVNWRLVAREVAYIVSDAEIALLVTDEERRKAAGSSVPTMLLVDRPHGDKPPFRQWLADFDPDRAVADLGPGDVAVQLYTSGTTGNPKGALLTHRSLEASLEQGLLTGEPWGEWHDDDVALVAMPQFHIGGTAWTMQSLNAGATAVLLAKADIGGMIEAIEQHRITKMFAVPAVLGMMVDHPLGATADLTSLRTLLYGASPIALDTLKRSMALFPNASFVQMYGSTETSGTIVYLPPEDHDVAGTPRMAGCGKPYPGVALRIVDGEGQDLGAGQVGEVLVRSDLVMAGYHKQPEASGEALAGGWFRTGDAGSLDADGYLYLLDRVKDMIVSGAENIYPAEIETVLRDHPAVADCAVIGVPDERWGEAVKAVVILKPGTEPDAAAIIAFARASIAAYKVPKSVDFAAELPRNAAGKVLKRTLRAAYWPQQERQVG